VCLPIHAFLIDGLRPCFNMRLGYNTNGFAHHDLIQAIRLLAEIGYQSVAITVDHGALNPHDERCSAQVDRVRELLEEYSLGTVIETGARFLLDPHTKHEPTLLSDDPAARERRIDFLCRCIRLAKTLGSDCVSCWSGVISADVPPEAALVRLIESLKPVLEEAARQGVMIGFEPEPGMFIDRMPSFEALIDRAAHPQLALTLDVGHLHCQGETPLSDQILRWAPHLVNVHLEDMRPGVHEHLMFGEGDIDFPSVIRALHEADYSGPVHVELSRHSDRAPAAARQAYEFLRPLIDSAGSRHLP
jgi:sugar phosphate isomerase/epimerase